MNTIADRPTDIMNAECYCMPIPRADIDLQMQRVIPGVYRKLLDRPNLFAGTAVFVAQKDVHAMLAQIKAIETVIQSPAYRQTIAKRDDINTEGEKTQGLFMGYDFHITPNGPRLIEINTNAGGAYIVAALEKAVTTESHLCHPGFQSELKTDERVLTETFFRDWASERQTPLKTIAIVDDAPQDQYLYPELMLIQNALEKQGVQAIITDPSALRYERQKLHFDDTPIDMVYNRLTDFDLSDPAHSQIRAAYQSGKIVLSPSPMHHALFADKRNLGLLADMDKLKQWGIDPATINTLSAIPKTRDVSPNDAGALWANRRHYFFKPKDGFGSRGSYRGAKLTKKVWANILQGGYVAQDYIPPTLRALAQGENQTQLKFDIRLYTYAGEPLSIAARVYQGQTTNFRTQGGGFAPVLMTESGA